MTVTPRTKLIFLARQFLKSNMAEILEKESQRRAERGDDSEKFEKMKTKVTIYCFHHGANLCIVSSLLISIIPTDQLLP